MEFTFVATFTNNPENYTIELEPDSNYGINLLPLCEYIHYGIEECNTLMDQLSSTTRNIYYTPTAINCGAEDFQSSRIDIVLYFGLNTDFNYRKYLEIGTATDELFSRARKVFDYAIGVDPNSGGTHRMTSDVFFAQNTEYFDVIFIDGLHEANQVFRDIHNALKWLSPGGTILMHDCNPRSFGLQDSIIPTGSIWTGDTWKAAVAMRLVMNVEIIIVDIDFGVGVIRRRHNKHPLPTEWLELLSVNPIRITKCQTFE